MKKLPQLSLISVALLSSFAYAEETQTLGEVKVTAKEQTKQSLGVSVISQTDLERTPVVNDVSEIIRTMPGVNFTSGSSTGQYGNKRQIDIRSMGPENTLILIDGKPATSRNAARYGRGGARNSRGDTNWVPAEEIESIEVIRGTAATRYGSGAMGGVVNIKTKPVTNEFKGSLSYALNKPENSKYGATNRIGFNVSGPLIENVLGFRLYGNWNKTKADAANVNQNSDGTWSYAGREGVRNKDIAGRLDWQITPAQKLTLDASYTRQGNIYAGDSESWGATSAEQELANRGIETNRLYRQAYSLTHEGKWSWGENKTWISYDKTVNSRLPVGLGFASEGHWTGDLSFVDSTLTNTRFNHEFSLPFTWYGEHLVTIGIEANHSKLDDKDSMSYNFETSGAMNLGYIPWLASGNRSGETSASEYGAFVEDKIFFNQGTTITPALRFDYHSVSGSNWSPNLNMSHDLTPYLTFTGGLARAYKAPNLYQSTENYVLANRQNNCPVNGRALNDVGSCYTVGNSNLKPETSFNKEIGFELHNQTGYKFGLTYFHNEYHNKIEADTTVLATVENPSAARAKVTAPTDIYKWDNVARATVEGLEGYVNLPLVAEKVNWNTSFTYLRKSVNKETGNPLSLSPKYTVNTQLNYQLTDSLDFTTTYTRYGKQLSRPNGVRYMDFASNGTDKTVQSRLGSYGLWGASLGYKWNSSISMRAGVSNLLNKIVSPDGKAATYNEPGRTYYMTMKYSF